MPANREQTRQTDQPSAANVSPDLVPVFQDLRDAGYPDDALPGALHVKRSVLALKTSFQDLVTRGVLNKR
jgi:hypothetical protein